MALFLYHIILQYYQYNCNYLIMYINLLPSHEGVDTPPYYTKGQLTSAAGMSKVASAINSQFVLALGDNFYDDGVTEEADPRFQETFEDVYTQDSLQNNWYAIAGNHGKG